jgi:DNA polymerase III subunit gamma/tau
MSYLVLARKCRPQVFEEVIGQPHVTRTLQNALKTGRVAHAYLFSGPRGVGKTSVARILAKALNCQEGPGPNPCNRCPSCKEITQGGNLDVFEIDGASNRGIDDIRELRENIRYLPARGRYKIYIVDEVHMLTKEAFNALLKTLEEPPDQAIFIFATTELNNVPLTIYSRCQSFHFRRISPEAMVKHLGRLVEQEQIAYREEALRLIARQAEGSIRDSLSLLDQILSFSPGEINETIIQEILGLVDRRLLLDLGRAVLGGDLKKIMGLVSEVYEYGYDLKVFFKDLVEVFRCLLLVKMGQEQGPLLDLSTEEISELKGMSAPVTLDYLQDGLHFLVQSEGELRKTGQPRLALEMILLRLARLQEVIPIDSLLQKLEQLEQGTRGEETPIFNSPGRPAADPSLKEEAGEYRHTRPRGAVPGPSFSEPPISIPPEPGPGPGPRPGGINPERLLEYIRKENLPLATYLAQGKLRILEDQTLEWDFQDNAFHLELMEGNGNKKRLEEICQAFCGKKVRVRLLGQAKNGLNAKKSTPAQQSQKKRKVIKETLEQPPIRDILEIFQAEVIDVKIPE